MLSIVAERRRWPDIMQRGVKVGDGAGAKAEQEAGGGVRGLRGV